MKRFLLFLSLPFFFACSNDPEPVINNPIPKTPEVSIPALSYTLKGTFPHDSLSFTEGLFFANGQLYESTGSPEDMPFLKSVFGPADLKTGKIDKKVELDRTKFFGEGSVMLNGKLYQLTYKNQVGFIYDAKTFKQIGRFSYSNKEGWGLTTDGSQLIMSDGTNMLTFLDPVTLKSTKTLNVRNAGYAEDFLNELEYINGAIYANVWTKNYLVKIDPSNGNVLATIDLSDLYTDAKSKNQYADVMNGIAYDSISKKIYVTGKLWKNIYEVEFPH